MPAKNHTISARKKADCVEELRTYAEQDLQSLLEMARQVLGRTFEYTMHSEAEKQCPHLSISLPAACFDVRVRFAAEWGSGDELAGRLMAYFRPSEAQKQSEEILLASSKPSKDIPNAGAGRAQAIAEFLDEIFGQLENKKIIVF